MKKRKESKNSSIFLEEKEKIEKELEEDLAQGIEIVNRNKEELDDERKARINKFERNANGQMIVKPKIRYKISTKLIIGIVIFVILATWFICDYGPIFGINVTNNHTTSLEENKIELVTKESDIYGMYDEELFVYSNNMITTYNNKGEVTWEYTFSESFSPSIFVKGNYMLVTNNSTGMMYLFENRKEILDMKVEGVIKNAFLDKYGNMAIEYANTSGYNNIITVYDKKGKNRYDAYLSQENIVELELLNNAEQMIFFETVTNSSSIGVKFRTVDISKKENEQIRDIASIDNAFVYDFKVQGENIYALLDNRIVSINLNSGEVKNIYEFSSTQLIFVQLNKNYYTCVNRNIEDENYTIQNVNYNGEEISSTVINSVPKSMVGSDLLNYYIYQDHVYIQNKWGVELKPVDTNFTPKKSIVFNKNKSLALIYTNKIYILNI